MREVKFRWIDRYLIHLTLKEKLLLLLGLPIIALLIFAAIGMHNDMQSDELAQQQLMQKEVTDMAHVLSIGNEAQARQILAAAGKEFQLLNKNGSPLSGYPGIKVDADKLGSHALLTADQMLVAAADVPGKPWLLAQQHPLLAKPFWDVAEPYAIMLSIALAILGVINYYITTFIGGALFSQVQALTRVADGDLTFRLNFLPVRDEFSTLAIAIDKLASRQHDMVKVIKAVSDTLSDAAVRFKNESTDTQALAQGQRQSLDSLATAMEEMSAAVKEVAHHAESASTETQRASEESAKGTDNIQHTISAIEQLSKEIFAASDAVAKVNDNASRIDEVVTTINAISEQTNLLALNAAIEAARAGEQGRGFAVVADEVRTLAARTQQATVEIQQMIEALQSGTDDVSRIMENTVQQAEHGGTLISQAGQDLHTINTHAEQVFSMMAQIAASAEQQSAVAEDITANISEVREQSLSVEDAAKNNASGTNELKGLSDRLAETLKGLTV
ncbi:methyl-accepting chemotaxis protein [Gallaecimonas sp. GXIMD1310]|uniref:methyl-accepting chemotaxis protein n=1 Tax=Gallaecimonas sp. GXIMD1310 TaxID=3131926 RepID=UPI0032510E48